MTKEESLYQAKLIIEELDFEDYRKISKETWDYIEKNMEYNESITIDPNKPLDGQNIDPQTIDFLEKVFDEIQNYKEELEQGTASEDRGVREEEQYTKAQIMELIQKHKQQVEKIDGAKKLLKEYEGVLKQNTEEIARLRSRNEELIQSISKCPRLVKKLFFSNLEKSLPE